MLDFARPSGSSRPSETQYCPLVTTFCSALPNLRNVDEQIMQISILSSDSVSKGAGLQKFGGGATPFDTVSAALQPTQDAALAAVVTVIGTLTMTTGICSQFELTPSLWGAELFPYLAMIVGLENTLCVTRSVVITPPSMGESMTVLSQERADSKVVACGLCDCALASLHSTHLGNRTDG